MAYKKPYQRPVLQAYGDIRTITAQQGCKEFGVGDGFWIGTPENPIRDCS